MIRKIFQIIALSISILAIGSPTLSNSLSNDDCNTIDETAAIDNAIKLFLSIQPETIGRYLDEKLIVLEAKPYSSSDEFNSLNPDCCTFSYRGAEGYLPNRFWRYKNNFVGFVEFKYFLMEPTDNTMTMLPGGQRFFAIDSCNQIIGSTFFDED